MTCPLVHARAEADREAKRYGVHPRIFHDGKWVTIYREGEVEQNCRLFATEEQARRHVTGQADKAFLRALAENLPASIKQTIGEMMLNESVSSDNGGWPAYAGRVISSALLALAEMDPC